ncbi:histidine kinase/DNA gyrase B/HSP90-like ATPase [Kribbella rubisoli]|uniref:Histidine kinase/DNA gyrase B/HSP90-like ATPase n=1 Tax=Kribbella rubisoli TaxID=3075929 RepID=A0A4Q7WW36_9ACTN|nr:ATP-binding protein [Kribbella rubisoli]RZU13975.1 histidine kinase/DNA gyrase B/HSP90-like ATPase [Kribbella rubisoli]
MAKLDSIINAGTPKGIVPVEISYRIIELFSAGLYSSPHKAIEELVCNSYDANATSVDILTAPSIEPENPEASIWVIDDGTSMDMEGLNLLWRIAESTKRAQENSDRPPIGKFGIGKLATYVLASQVTYVCRTEQAVLAVSMDYGNLDAENDPGIRTATHDLTVRELNETDLRRLLAPVSAFAGGKAIQKRLLDPRSGTWTAVAMSGLKDKASQIKQGRLNWLLSTALPNSPQFALRLNGQPVVPKKSEADLLDSWKIGERPINSKGVAATFDKQGNPVVTIEGVNGSLHGVVEIYKEVLDPGTTKAERLLGRSHGFFVMVRGRLVNLDDPLFGRTPLSHSSFARFRLVIYADGLDNYLTSGRESIADSPAVDSLREYLKLEFNRARLLYDAWVEDETKAARLSTRIGKSDGAITRRPLAGAVKRALRGETGQLTLIDTPDDLTAEEAEQLSDDIGEAAVSEDGLIESIEAEARGADAFLSRYDAQRRTVYVNVLHPFYGNFIDLVKSRDIFDAFAVAEVLTEAYLIEEGVDASTAHRILARRDTFLRELVARDRRSAPIIAQYLLDQADNEKGLEEAVKESLKVLGFEVSPIGGNGTPDGLATATLGYRREMGAKADYSFTYDAKSSSSKRITADKVGVSRLARHREDYKADYGIVVAPDFDGAGDENSALIKECRADGRITPVRVVDLALLVIVASRRQLSFTRLREIFETCRTPVEVRDWIEAAMTEPESKPPFREILDVIQELQQSYEDAVTIPAVTITLRNRGIRLREAELTEYIHSMTTQAPAYIDLAANDVRLNVSPERVMHAMSRQDQELDNFAALLHSHLTAGVTAAFD